MKSVFQLWAEVAVALTFSAFPALKLPSLAASSFLFFAASSPGFSRPGMRWSMRPWFRMSRMSRWDELDRAGVPCRWIRRAG